MPYPKEMSPSARLRGALSTAPAPAGWGDRGLARRIKRRHQTPTRGRAGVTLYRLRVRRLLKTSDQARWAPAMQRGRRCKRRGRSRRPHHRPPCEVPECEKRPRTGFATCPSAGRQLRLRRPGLIAAALNAATKSMDAFDFVSKERVNTLRPACRSCRQSSGC
eukprot:scaffold10652_cov26-Phaeocystis_antarctica.AAC.1